MLKIIAMLTMLIDHIGVFFFPDEDGWRIIGRVAFPLYAYFIALGYRYTRDLKRYALRLLALALLCHLPVLFGIEMSVYNVIFTLFGGLLALILLDKPLSLWLRIPGLTTIAAAAVFFPIDYGIYGILTVVMFHYFKDVPLLLAHAVLNAVFIFVGDLSNLQIFSLAATLLLFVQYKLPVVPVNKTFYWMFYPLHLAVLYALQMWLFSD